MELAPVYLYFGSIVPGFFVQVKRAYSQQNIVTLTLTLNGVKGKGLVPARRGSVTPASEAAVFWPQITQISQKPRLT